MFATASEETFPKGQIIFKEGSSGTWIYHIISGSVEVSRMVDGKKVVLEILKEGEVFGELSFIGNVKRSATVTALSDTVIGLIDRDNMDQEFNKLSSDFRTVLRSISNRFEKMLDQVSAIPSKAQPRPMKTLAISYKDKQDFLKAYASNISGGGLFIKTKTPLPIDEQLFLKLKLPDFPKPLTIKSQVAFIRSDKEETSTQPSGMGLKFLEMSQSDSALLQQFMTALVGE